MHCEDAGCNKIACFGDAKERKRRFCSAHSVSPYNTDLVHPICEAAGCAKMASFGSEQNAKLVVCGKHRRPGDVDLIHPKCISDNCTTTATFGAPADGKRRFCADHKRAGDIDCGSARCEYYRCSVHASFGGADGGKRRFCRSHCRPTDVLLTGPSCDVAECRRRKTFGSAADRKAKYCLLHKRASDIDLLAVQCKGVDPQGTQCKRGARYGSKEGEKDYCREHRRSTDVLLMQTCEHEGCYVSPSFGCAKDGKRRYCSEHKGAGDVNLHGSKSCEICSAGAACGDPADGKKRFCQQHKRPGDVDLKHHNCSVCGKRAAGPKQSDGQHLCTGCEARQHSGAARVCDECARAATFGLEASHRRCRLHKNEADEDLSEQCRHNGCIEQARFCSPDDPSALLCHNHKRPTDLLCFRQKTPCEHPSGCDKIGMFGALTSRRGRWCRAHKRRGDRMFSLRHHRCTRSRCTRTAHFGPQFGSDRAKKGSCVQHKAADQVFIVDELCEFQGCHNWPTFGVDGVAVRCSSHRCDDDLEVPELMLSKDVESVILLQRMDECRTGSAASCHALAAAQGGVLVSKKFRKTQKQRYECTRRHSFSLSFEDLRSKGAWCTRCANIETALLCTAIEEKRQQLHQQQAAGLVAARNRKVRRTTGGRVRVGFGIRGSVVHKPVHVGFGIRRRPVLDSNSKGSGQLGDCAAATAPSAPTEPGDWSGGEVSPCVGSMPADKEATLGLRESESLWSIHGAAHADARDGSSKKKKKRKRSNHALPLQEVQAEAAWDAAEDAAVAADPLILDGSVIEVKKLSVKGSTHRNVRSVVRWKPNSKKYCLIVAGERMYIRQDKLSKRKYSVVPDGQTLLATEH